jgi:ABC-type molybdate transport system substrate-binding protein
MEVLDEVSILTVAQALQSSSDQRRTASPFILLADKLVILWRAASKRSIEAINCNNSINTSKNCWANSNQKQRTCEHEIRNVKYW